MVSQTLHEIALFLLQSRRMCILILMFHLWPMLLWMYPFCAEPQLLPRPCWVENHCSSPTWPHQSVWILLDTGIGENYREWGKRYCVLFSWLWVLFLYRLFSAIICFHWDLIVSCQIWNALTSCLHLDQSSSGCSLKKLCVHVKYMHIYIYTSMCMKCISSYFLIQCTHLLIFNYIWYKSKVCCKTLYLRTVLKNKKPKKKSQPCNTTGTCFKTILCLTSLLPE